MGKAYALLRAGFPYVKTLGMRRITSNPIDLALGREGRLYVLCRGALATEIRRYTWDDEDLGIIGGSGTTDGKFLCLGPCWQTRQRTYTSLTKAATGFRRLAAMGCS